MRSRFPFLEHDRPFAPAIAAIEELVDAGAFNALPGAELLPSLGASED